MRADEGITLTKMAVVAMLTTLVLGAMFALFYFMSEKTSGVQDSMNKATNTAATERLYQLQEQSETADVTAANNVSAGMNPVDAAKQCIDDHPLVTTCASIISEYNEDSLLYIYITPHSDNESVDKDSSHVYTFNGVTLTSNEFNVEDTGSGTTMLWGSSGITARVFQSDTPKTAAMKELLIYSQYRCHVHMVSVPYNGQTFTGIVIEILTM